MSTGESIEEIKKHTRVYITVFMALLALTVITVAVSYLDLGLTASITVALFIAIVKGSLVALFFMHLISERMLIYYALIVTIAFFAFLMIVPVVTDNEAFFVK